MTNKKPQREVQLKLPLKIVEWEGSDSVFDANDQPLYINVPNEPHAANMREMIRLINHSCVNPLL